MRFFLTGRRESMGQGDLRMEELLPVQLLPYAKLRHTRTPYPVCFIDGAAGPTARSLTDVIDEALDAVAPAGDEGEMLRRSVLRVEAGIRTRCDETEGVHTLHGLWQEMVEEAAPGRPQKSAPLGEKLEEVRAQLPDASVAGLSVSTVRRLVETAVRTGPARPQPDRAAEVDGLISKLTDILAVDERSEVQTRPDHLEAALHDDGIDAGALAELLSSSPSAPRLAEERRHRIEDAISALRAWRTRSEAEPEMVASPEQARQQLRVMGEELVALHRSLAIARLEVENRYRPSRHDDHFASLTLGELSQEEVGYAPPLLVHVRAEEVQPSDWTTLLDLLSQRLPVKVLVSYERISDIDTSGTATGGQRPWADRFAQMAMMIGTAGVAQTAASSLEDLLEMASESGAQDGPSLLCVYVGPGEATTGLHAHLRAAIAADGRAFPSFSWLPNAGSSWDARFRIDHNAAPESDWLREEGSDPDAEPFTFLHFAACSAGSASQFWPLTGDGEGAGLAPVHEYLEMTSAEAARHLPFITVSDAEGTTYRAVVSRSLIGEARQVLGRWHRLQELAGINNSHVERRLREERERMEAEHAAATEALEAAHRDELDRVAGGLAEEIVSNIAAGLLEMPAREGALSPPPARPARVHPPEEEEAAPAEDAEPEPEETPAAEEQEEEVLSFDEPYIETPRCTTCNECTNLNGAMFAYNEDQQAYIADASAGTYRELVLAAEECPVRIIHPGKPLDPDEPDLETWKERAKPYL